MTPAAQAWQRASETAKRQPSQTRNALACKRRREQLRAARLCIFCGRNPAASLCARCQRTQGEQRRENYRAAVEAEGRSVRPYRRKGARP